VMGALPHLEIGSEARDKRAKVGRSMSFVAGESVRGREEMLRLKGGIGGCERRGKGSPT